MQSRSVVLGSLLLSASALAGPSSQPILGGTQATDGQFPTVVLLEVGGGLCTGTLIHPEWVLTAAHCVQGLSPTGARVHFGTVNLGRSQGTVITSSELYAKPTFSQSMLGQNDIGLIKLSKAVTDITPLPVNLVPEKAPVGTAVTMVGFGATAQGGGGSVGVEYVVEQTSVTCSSYGVNDANMLCFNQSSGKGKCQGDSGGPSFAMIDGRMTQVGITSFGDQNCAAFGADTRTDAEKAFFLEHIPQLECASDADCPMGRMCWAKKCIAQPFSPTGLGATCTGNGECDSNQCAMAGAEAHCSMTCTVGAADACPLGLECLAAGASGACWPVPDDTGCCDASGRGAPTMLFGIAVVGLVWRRRRGY